MPESLLRGYECREYNYGSQILVILKNSESSYRPLDYFNAGLPLSIYGPDDDKTMADVIQYYPKLKAIFTNYPAKLISKLREQKYID